MNPMDVGMCKRELEQVLETRASEKSAPATDPCIVAYFKEAQNSKGDVCAQVSVGTSRRGDGRDTWMVALAQLFVET